MRVYDHTSHSYHYYDAANESGRRIGGAAVEHNDFMHYAYVEHCKTDKDHCAKIVFVQTNKSERLKGVATSLLNKITADYEGWDLFLNVRPLDTDQERFTTVQELTRFYEKFGFKRCEGAGSMPAMIKPAKIQ